MKILIFGGLGYLGNSLKKKLQIQGHNVKVFSNRKFNKKSKINTLNYSKKNFENLIKKVEPNIIFYFSGNSNPRTSKNHIYDLLRSNIPLQNFLEAMKTINFKGKIFYSSSIAVYGNMKSKEKIKESHYEPANFYGLSKLISEKQLMFYVKNFNLDIIILRIASFFGPGLKKQFIYEYTRQALRSKNIKLKGNINDKRDLLTISYLVEIISKLIKKKKYHIQNN
jgi:UDP-glucose 4-epimerase